MADNQGLKAVSFLKLIIGDKNDNPMESGSSEIFVYNYLGLAPTTQIGRVYVNDPDDWDLPDKSFFFKETVLCFKGSVRVFFSVQIIHIFIGSVRVFFSMQIIHIFIWSCYM